jgi:hypothetical protein
MKTGWLYVLLMVFALLCTACGPQPDISSIQATAAAETSLTGMYGTEVRAAIENFETKWYSLEEHLDPEIQSQIATGEFLRQFGHTYNSSKPFGEPYGLLTKSAVVVSVRVLEYGPQRFKAVAGVVEQTDQVTPQGEFTKSLPFRKFCGVYVFLKEENIWKLAAFFDITDSNTVARDWENASVTLKPIVGDLPESDCNFNSLP